MKEDMTGMLLEDCSPYIKSIIYDIGKRELNLVCVNNPEKMIPKKRIICTGILKYEEENVEAVQDDNLLDSIIGINWEEKGKLCIHTEKKIFFMVLENGPKSEDIA